MYFFVSFHSTDEARAAWQNVEVGTAYMEAVASADSPDNQDSIFAGWERAPTARALACFEGELIATRGETLLFHPLSLKWVRWRDAPVDNREKPEPPEPTPAFSTVGENKDQGDDDADEIEEFDEPEPAPEPVSAASSRAKRLGQLCVIIAAMIAVWSAGKLAGTGYGYRYLFPPGPAGWSTGSGADVRPKPAPTTGEAGGGSRFVGALVNAVLPPPPPLQAPTGVTLNLTNVLWGPTVAVWTGDGRIPQIVVSWIAVRGAESYRVTRNDGREFTVTGTTFTDQPGCYKYTVAAVRGDEVAQAQETGRICTPLRAPAWAKAELQDDGTILVTWEDVPGAAGYEVSRQGRVTGGPEDVVRETVTNTRYVDAEPGGDCYQYYADPLPLTGETVIPVEGTHPYNGPLTWNDPPYPCIWGEGGIDLPEEGISPQVKAFTEKVYAEYAEIFGVRPPARMTFEPKKGDRVGQVQGYHILMYAHPWEPFFVRYVAHELVHVFQMAYEGQECGPEPTTYVTEGLAEYLSYDATGSQKVVRVWRGDGTGAPGDPGLHRRLVDTLGYILVEPIRWALSPSEIDRTKRGVIPYEEYATAQRTVRSEIKALGPENKETVRRYIEQQYGKCE